ncbi:MAG: ABC transporter permease [Bacillus sp. (in: Bacteria)]|nr:ABC transporter permease [Bacillus sp. (in: firmicutes)]MCM1426922.1 ABC transporter permease [Eubacterium sp.]
MAQIWEYIKIAFMNIKSNKGRSVLTMLGIIIGIASVIMIMAIGNGVRGQINDELESIGSGLIELYLDTTLDTTTMRFAQEDFELVMDKVEHVKGATPYMGGWGTANGPKGNYEARVMGGNEGLQYYSANGGSIIKGRYFSKSDADSANRVCVIPESSAVLLFGTTDVVGMSFEVTLYGISQELTITGIREDSATSIVNSASASYVSLELPVSVMGNDYYFYIDEFSDMIIFADSTEYCTEVAQNAVRLLENKYDARGEGQIIVQSISDMSAEYDSILGIVTLFISFVAAISLLVGGIGVMNIMLVSVTERTREIGIRKALGARTGSILLQFLAEAGIITLLGGLIGIVIGILGGNLICSIAGVTARTQISTIIGATLFSSAVGIFFGIYPAKKAAKLSPIEALRHE